MAVARTRPAPVRAFLLPNLGLGLSLTLVPHQIPRNDIFVGVSKGHLLYCAHINVVVRPKGHTNSIVRRIQIEIVLDLRCCCLRPAHV